MSFTQKKFTRLRFVPCHLLSIWLLTTLPIRAAVLFEDDFNRGLSGWTSVKPAGAYLDGPLLWSYDVVSGALVERSNIYTDNATFSPTATAPMLINDAITAINFTYSGRLTAGDDDGFGLIFGYQDETNFFRVSFARQSRAGFPWTGWSVDRKINGVTSNLFGAGTTGYVQTFVNTANRPFDATITVDTSSRLTLTVVDSPTGTPVNHTLVNQQAIPAAFGKVGIFTWGMSGGTPNGFRIQNLALAPANLAGGGSGLEQWTPVVPPRSNGSVALSGGAGQPAWSLAVGENGPEGALIENSDALGGNDVAGQVDFTGPTLVAGDLSWTNYTMAARIIPGDDDGHGILLRYRDSTNFYRIALRSQNSGTGIPRGLSIQRNINRVYSQVYQDNTVEPLSNVPYELIASISNNILNALLIHDPDGSADARFYGPIDLGSPMVPNGKIGLFSWAMTQTKFDFVTVQDGTPLHISSAYGSPSPAKGLNSFPPGSLVQASAGDVVTNVAGIRRLPAGWSGSGSVPANGAASTVSFTVNEFSHLQWLWRTEYYLSVTNSANGSVSFPAGDWFAAGDAISVSAIANPGYVFSGWLGDFLSTSPVLNISIDRPTTLVATFTVDSDEDGLPDEWEMAYFNSLLPTPGGDPDHDGRTTLEEFHNGTNPTVADNFRITRLLLTNNVGLLDITNNSGTRFSIQMATNLPGPWSTIASTQQVTRFTAPVPAGGKSFWRLQQPERAPDVAPFVPGSWTLAVLPDTQLYSQSYPDLFKDQTRWIVENRDRLNIKYVLHLGDIVNIPTALNQWDNAKAAMSMLDGIVPYAFVTGNHDHGTGGGANDRTTLVNNYFPVSNYTAWPTFGGTMETNRIENSYHLFSAGGVDWLIIALEWGPRNTPVAWANQIVNNYPDRKVILITHAYMYYDETRYDWATKGSAQTWNPYSYGTANDPDGTNDGEDLWRKLVKIHPNFVMVFNGHVLNDGLGTLSSPNDFGNMVHQMLVNYQMKPLGGEAFLRLVEFHPDGKTVQIKAYSPLYGIYKTDPQNQFKLTLTPPLK